MTAILCMACSVTLALLVISIFDPAPPKEGD